MPLDWPPQGVSLTKPGARYYTSTKTCSCLDWNYRRKRTGRPCKHQKSLRRAVSLQTGIPEYNPNPLNQG